MNIITGYRGEPHITSSQDRAENQGTFGEGSYVLDVGSKLAATAVSATEIRIADGVISHQGCLAIIENGTYDTLSIANGSQGMNRIDLIVARYTKNSGTSVENMELVVIQGTATSSTPSAPSYNQGDIQDGDSPVDMPLYQVRLSGITLSSVNAVFSVVKTQKETDSAINTLNSYFINPSQRNTFTWSSVIAAGYFTTNSTALVFFVPMPYTTGTVSVTDLTFTIRHVGGGYVYARSGNSGGTYTQLGSSSVSVWENSASKRTNEVASVSVTRRALLGLWITVTFTYALTTNTSGTAVTNNAPTSVVVGGTITIS